MAYSTTRLMPATSQPNMASLMEKAWMAKCVKMKRQGVSSQVAQRRINKAPQPTKRREKPSISTLLSRRVGINILMTIKVRSLQVAPRRNSALQPVKRRPEKPSISPLLSRRLGINTLITIKIPNRKPFPPPLVWKRDQS